jgi:hypothetical protein
LTPRLANLLTAAGLVLLLALVAFTAPRWASWLRREVPGTENGSSGGGTAPDDEAARVERQISVKLFFQAADRPGLVIEQRSVGFSSDLAGQVRAVMDELIRGSSMGLQPTLDPKTRVLEVFVSARGVAYLDLSKEAQALAAGGSEAELITVYSIVSSLTANFPAIKRVQILVEDRPATTLAGHVDLTRPLPPDMTLLAAAPLRPAASAQ